MSIHEPRLAAKTTLYNVVTFWSAILLHYDMNVSENLDPQIDLSLKLF